MSKEDIFDIFRNGAVILNDERLLTYINFCIDNNDVCCEGEEHHILPRSLFPEFGNFLEFPNNKTKLTYINHLKAHYLLILSIESEEMLYAFNMMNNFYNKNNIANLEHYDLMKKQFNIFLKTSIWSKSSKDKKWLFYNGKYKLVHKNDLEKYLSEGWIFQSHSKNTVWKNNGIICKRVLASNIQYIDWVDGRLETKSKNKSTWITKDNTKKRVLYDELPNYLDDGWIIGSGENVSTKDYIRISKDNVNKSILKDEKETYLSEGWSLGAYRVYCVDCHTSLSSLGKHNHKCKGKNYEYNFYIK